MNASPAPAAPPRTREPTDEPLAAETLAAHARRALRTGVRARVTTALDAGIAFLERLREKTGGVREKAEDIDGRRRSARRGASAAADETPGDVPRPKRRLRALLIHLGVLLAGGIGGGVLAYTLFQQQLDRVLTDSLHRDAARAKQAQPATDIQQAFEDARVQRGDAEKKLAASLAAYSGRRPAPPPGSRACSARNSWKTGGWRRRWRNERDPAPRSGARSKRKPPNVAMRRQNWRSPKTP